MRLAGKVGLAVAGLVIGIAMGSALEPAAAQETKAAPKLAYQVAIIADGCANKRCGNNGACPWTQTGTYCAVSSSGAGQTCETKSCSTSYYAMSVTEALSD